MHFVDFNFLVISSTSHQPLCLLLGTPILLLLPHWSNWYGYSSSPITRLVRVHNWTNRSEIDTLACSLSYLITHVALDDRWSNLWDAALSQYYFLVAHLLGFISGSQSWRNHYTHCLFVKGLIRILIVSCLDTRLCIGGVYRLIVGICIEVLHVPDLAVRRLKY